MSISQQNEIEALKARVTALESLVGAMSPALQTLQNHHLSDLQSRQVLSLSRTSEQKAKHG